MNFSSQQEEALAMVDDWLGTDEQVFRLFGYAGTGKTTLARHIGADHFAAYTGKAAHVLREKGCGEATTIHSLIYNTRDKSKERLRKLEDQRIPDHEDHYLEIEISREIKNLQQPSFSLNLDSPLRRAKLLVIDECSMVDGRVGEDLLSFGCKVLVLGDPAQLPPVGGGGFFTSGEPDYLLTEIHRQARENPILDLATRIREGNSWKNHPLVSRTVDPQEAISYDQIIVGRNKTRSAINRRQRQLIGMDDPLPMPGDRVVCLRNNHEMGLMNGALFTLNSCEISGPQTVGLLLDNGVYTLAHKAPFLGHPVDVWMKRDYDEFDYGYALTCHKSQGSQWDSVLVFDESICFQHNSRRWLYTAVTRAAKKLKVVSQ